MNGWRVLAKTMIPAQLRALVRGTLGWTWFAGNYSSWAEARADSAGYDDASILEKVVEATRAVRSGRGAFERDGVLFTAPCAEPGLLDAVETVAKVVCPGSMSVIDFGGALGTTFWRHRSTFQRMGVARWDVVEQSRFVVSGKEFQVEPVAFFESVQAAQLVANHHLLLSSGTLQYLEDPFAALTEWMNEGFPWMILNNLPLHARGPDRIAVQRVPPEVYTASYPVWFFNRDRFLATFNGRYDLAAEFASEAVWLVGRRYYPSTGLLFRKKTKT